MPKFVKLKYVDDHTAKVMAVVSYNSNHTETPFDFIRLPKEIPAEEAVGMWVVDGKWLKERPFDPNAKPVPSLLWSGHLYDYSGYAKANREILFRIAKNIKVAVLTSGLEHGSISVDADTRAKLDAFRCVSVSKDAPLLRFFGPDYASDPRRHRIVWTMMETYKIHPDMVRLVNENFDELWTPTEWNRRVFVESGVTVQSRAVPLGVDTSIYRPIPRVTLPKCRLVSTRLASTMAVPSGFNFFTVGLPSFRKGFDVLAEAFDMAFAGRPDVNLILGITHSLQSWKDSIYTQLAGSRARVWTLEGQYSEYGLAGFYSACHAYVSASRGEGWNLPACEAAACGLPVIVPDNTCHRDVVGENGFMFPIEGIAEHSEANTVSPWYNGMPFAVFGRKSVSHLADILRLVEEGGALVRERATRLQDAVRKNFTWDAAAKIVERRIVEVQRTPTPDVKDKPV